MPLLACNELQTGGRGVHLYVGNVRRTVAGGGHQTFHQHTVTHGPLVIKSCKYCSHHIHIFDRIRKQIQIQIIKKAIQIISILFILKFFSPLSLRDFVILYTLFQFHEFYTGGIKVKKCCTVNYLFLFRFRKLQ